MKTFYDTWYRFGTPPWVGQARQELVDLVESGVLPPGRAIDLGCGEGDNAIFLAQHGFHVTAIDFAPAAIEKAKAKSREAGVDVTFVVDDLTRPTTVHGQFDLLVDYGTFDDLSIRQRAAYAQGDRAAGEHVPTTPVVLESGNAALETVMAPILVEATLTLLPVQHAAIIASTLDVEQIAGGTGLVWPRGWAAYLMTRRWELSISPA